MNDNEIITVEPEDLEVSELETASPNNGLKTVGTIAITAAIGTCLFFGVKKLVKKIKERKQNKYIEVATAEDEDETDEEQS